MKKNTPIILLILGLILNVVGVVALYYEYGSEIYFTCGALCIIVSVVLLFSNNYAGRNVVISLLIALAILAYIVSAAILPTIVVLIVVAILIVLFKVLDNKKD